MAWIQNSDRRPPRAGTYEIRRRRGKSRVTYDRYLWNGAYWVTGRGNPASDHLEWYEDELNGNQDGQEGTDNVQGAD